MMITLATPVESVPRIAKKIVPALRRLGIFTIRDLLYHFPARYENYTPARPIANVLEGETATIHGRVIAVSTRRTLRRKMILTEALIADETGRIAAVWFNQPFIARNIREGIDVSLSGKVAHGARGLTLQNPAYEKLQAAGDQQQATIHTGGLIPVYPETEGITSRWFRYLIESFLDTAQGAADPLPEETRSQHNFPQFTESITAIHFPDTEEAAESARRRFAFEELLVFQIRALAERSRMKKQSAPAIPFDVALIKKFVATLPFALTTAQRKALYEIAKDLERSSPMNRILNGDVGSGKTVVAAAASLLATSAGYSVALMAPTEILARQHCETFRRVFAPFGITIGLCTGTEKTQTPSPITIGTHALIQKGVVFDNLGLVIVDEQHRFGVGQRAHLLNRGQTRDSAQTDAAVPHFLSMTATPIPRTIALTIYGNLDVSVLDELPPNRRPVITRVVKSPERAAAYDFMRREVRKGRQIFVICPRIDKNEIPNSGDEGRDGKFQQQFMLYDMKSVKEEYEKLSKEIFPDLKITMLHGKMRPKEKDAVMAQFKDRTFDILVSTSVIEVGVDIPNAAIMMIESAERFGLAQLHQFRGRVGRGTEQSYCLLFPGEDVALTRRLSAMMTAKNGFELAELDLKIRGAGDIFGARQWGIPDVALSAMADAHLIRAARDEAIALIKKSPDLALFPELRRHLIRTQRMLHEE